MLHSLSAMNRKSELRVEGPDKPDNLGVDVIAVRSSTDGYAPGEFSCNASVDIASLRPGAGRCCASCACNASGSALNAEAMSCDSLPGNASTSPASTASR